MSRSVCTMVASKFSYHSFRLHHINVLRQILIQHLNGVKMATRDTGSIFFISKLNQSTNFLTKRLAKPNREYSVTNHVTVNMLSFV